MNGEVAGLRTIGHSDLGGYGDGMQVLRAGDALYVGHFGPSGMGTSILDVSDPADPQLVRQWRAPHGSHTHKVQVADGLLLVNHEQFRGRSLPGPLEAERSSATKFRGGDPYSAGMAVYSLDDPFAPEQIGWFDSTGRGVHRIVWTGGRYAYVSAIPEGFDDRIWIIVDMSAPEHPTEAGRWWWPGQFVGSNEAPTWPAGKRYAAHHALVEGDRAYLGYGDGNLVILDIADVSNPRRISDLQWSPGGDTHTCMPLPGRDLLVTTDEVVTNNCEGEEHFVRLVDITEDKAPALVGRCPAPDGNFCERGLRFGPHNLHENRPGTYRSAQVVFVTYFNAGLRVYDVSKPTAPVEIAHWIPATPRGQEAVQINDVFVAEDLLIYVTDRVNGGVYIVEPDERLSTSLREAAL